VIKKAVGYTRVSTENQLDNFSIPEQEDAIREYCRQNGFHLVNIYNEGAGSGASLEDREVFIEMLQNVLSSNNIDYIIVHKQDRFARNQVEALYLLNLLQEHGKNLICIADNINTENETAKLFFSIKAMIAEQERWNINFNTKKGMKKRAESGLFNGGRVYGYITTPSKTLEIHPEQAKIVRFIFEKYAIENWGYKKIASFLNRQGIKTLNNREWTINGIKTILTNPIYVGFIRWGQYKNWNKRRRKGKADPIISKGQHQPIISTELWNKTQEILQVRSHMPQKLHHGSYFLSGLLKCPQCGASMVQHKSGGGKYKYYQCSNNKNGKRCGSNLVNADYAEQYVISELSSLINNPELFKILHDKIQQQLNLEIRPALNYLKGLQNDLQNLDKNIAETFDLMYDKAISQDVALEQISRLENRKKKITQEITKLEENINYKTNLNIALVVKNILNNFESFFNQLDDAQKKELLRTLIKEIQVYPSKNAKGRKIKKIEYYFNVNDLTNLVTA
jgi:site-specific DNA recombinase